jgi:HD-GYP domain-containing protein (c-di-GMP phosphodiesterase class II)
LYPFLTTPFTPIKFSDGLAEIIQNRIANIPESTFDINSFVAIKLLFLRKFKNIPFDIYIELSKDKHIKIRNRGDQLDDDLISRYKSKGVKEFYITSNDFNNYHESIYTLPLISDDSKTQKPDQKIKEIHEVLVEVMGDVGLSEEVIILANQYSKNILEYSGSKASVALMLETAIKNDYSYLYDHSYMTSVICVKVSRKINWMTSAMIEKVCMGAIFHDLYLGHAKYSYKLDVKEHDINGIPKNDRGVYFHHPTEMANILKDTDSIPQEVINIVSQHHEKVDGTGFPQKLSSLTMSPTVGLFIMVHDFVNELYRINFDCRQYANLITNTVEKYAVGNFKEIANAFEGAMMEEMQNTKSA